MGEFVIIFLMGVIGGMLTQLWALWVLNRSAKRRK